MKRLTKISERPASTTTSRARQQAVPAPVDTRENRSLTRAARCGRHPGSRHAFTLVELMVVIVVILILLSIGLTVGGQVVRNMEESRCREILSNANQIATEYEAGKGLARINHLSYKASTASGVTSPAYDWTQAKKRNSPPGTTAPGSLAGTVPDGTDKAETSMTNPNDGDVARRSIERFVWASQSMSSLKKLYANFKPQVLVDMDSDGFLELRDPWGTKLAYGAYVRIETFPAGGPLAFQADDFLPLSEDPVFASAGPDKKWGDVRDLNKQLQGLPDGFDPTRAREAADNIYSFGVLNTQ